MRFRILSMTLCLMWQWLCTFSIVRIMPVALETVTTKTYFIFACIFICGAPYVYFFIPETKDLPLEYMDRLFGDGRTDVEKALEEGANKPTNEFIEEVKGGEAMHNGIPTLATVRE